MNLCRFQSSDSISRVGLINEGVVDLSAAGIKRIGEVLEKASPIEFLKNLDLSRSTRFKREEITLLAPVDRQEVWAAGVTYFRSKRARMEESSFSAQAYDKVYDAPRPEIFFKSLPEKVVAHGSEVGIRKDAKWNVPEPELAFVINPLGSIVGYSIGNDMSARDIEAANLLYLPQAKIYDCSCAVGPWIVLGKSEAEAREWEIEIEVCRGEAIAFSASTSISQIKRKFSELSDYLCRSQHFPHGAILLSGTGIVPDDDFTLRLGDVIKITISGIGSLENPVCEV